MLALKAISCATNNRYYAQTERVFPLYKDGSLNVLLYCFELDEESRELTTIVTLLGKYRYRRLPMGVKVSPDYAQALIAKILKIMT